MECHSDHVDITLVPQHGATVIVDDLGAVGAPEAYHTIGGRGGAVTGLGWGA